MQDFPYTTLINIEWEYYSYMSVHPRVTTGHGPHWAHLGKIQKLILGSYVVTIFRTISGN